MNNKAKKVIKLNESQLRQVIRESIVKMLKEDSDGENEREYYAVGKGGGYFGGSPIFSVEKYGSNVMYIFRPQGWDYKTKSQLEAAAICYGANKQFLEQLKESNLTYIPVVQPTKEDIIEALYWLTGGNAEWNQGYWREGGVEWNDETIDMLLGDSDIMQRINECISSSSNFVELVLNLRKTDLMVYAADILPVRDYEELSESRTAKKNTKSFNK